MPNNQFNFYRSFILVLVHIIMGTVQVFSQDGLGFASHEVVQDKRTGLSLFPDNSLCTSENFELAFDLSFYPNQDNYFGYIVRIINDKGKSVDLVYDQDFRVVVGEKLTSLEFNIPNERLFSRWTRIGINFNVEKGELSLLCNGNKLREALPLAKDGCYRIYFGLIDYKHYSSTDVPAMKIKDVSISQKGKRTYHWPLNEKNGTVAHDQVKHMQALATNPLWINKLHFDWQLVKQFHTSGTASFAYNPKTETVFLVGADSLIAYDLKANRTTVKRYTDGRLHLPDGNQSIFDTLTNKLLNFNVDEAKTLKFDWANSSWSGDHVHPAEKTDHGHANKFICTLDTSLYVIGGYGNFYYKNDVYRYALNKERWTLIDSQATNCTPHYLAALGAVRGGAYLVGGYGSATGMQVLNPKNIYDLVYFDAAKKTFIKKFELKAEGEDFVFANSLVIDTLNERYYGLIFPKHKFQSHLQLISGSLKDPAYELLGNTIPYQFSDAHSFADLYYSAAGHRFIAVTSYLDEQGMTSAQIYTLSSPPLPNVAGELTVNKSAESPFLLVCGIALLLIAGSVIWHVKRRKQGLHPIKDEQIGVEKSEPKENGEEVHTKIYLFGDLSILNLEGEDITKYFTPLLKELFLLILLYTIRWQKGISSEKLIELLWFDKSEESARNNRSANIAKLKQVLDKYATLKLLKEGNYWRLVWASETYIDYQLYLNLIQQKIADKALILACSAITKRGSFLNGIEYEWLDTFKSEVATKIVSIYLQQMQSLPISSNADLLIGLANEVFLFDSVNEEAVIIKCKALASLGQHSQAAHTFESFRKEYETLYGQKFEKDFKSIMAD